MREPIDKVTRLRIERMELTADIKQLEIVYTSMTTLHNACEPEISRAMDTILGKIRMFRRELERINEIIDTVDGLA
ncbi:hypothetical protein P70_0078 [Listeria phage P70]|uniref:Uncharacterized protein n=1 Tax=Listeria phage P70 TaxID=1225800 RepID=J9QPC0_9CAUD|nr:hypothetical protein P70_0078 [Listeria phage P70]AFQ96267.1 hypothetical protein P70_0078 [Listeria phage P70]